MNLRSPPEHQRPAQDGAFMASYLEAPNLLERLHRLLDDVKDEFERLGILDVNPVQALLLQRRRPGGDGW